MPWSASLKNGKYDFRSVAQNTIYLMTKSIVVYLLRLVYIAMCARFLGPEIYGLLIYGQTWYMLFLPFALMGLQPVISRMVGLDRSRAREISAQTLSLRLVSTLLAVTACIFIAQLVSDEGEVRTIIYVFSFALAGRSIAQWTTEIFNAFEASQYTLRQESLFRVIELVAGLVFLLSGKGIIYLAVLHGVTWWLQAARGLYIVNIKCTRIHLDCSISSLKPVLLTAVPFLMDSLLVNWEQQGPIILFRNLLDDNSLAGEFTLLLQILIILSSIYLSVAIAALPVLSRSAGRNDGKDLMFVDMLVRSTFILGALAGMTGAALGPLIIPLVFGEGYTSAAEYLGLMLWCLLPIAISGIMTTCSIARGHYYIAPLCHAAGAFVMTASMPVFASRWGIFGGIASTGLGLLASAMLLVAVGMKYKWLDIRRTIVIPMLVVLLALGFYLMAGSFSAWAAYPSGVTALFIISALTGAASYSDLELIRRTFRKETA